MGRKRTSNKAKVLVSVDKELIDKLRELNCNRSVLFTDAATQYIKDFVNNENNDKKD